MDGKAGNSSNVKDKDRVYRIISDAYKTEDPSNYPTQSIISEKIQKEKNLEREQRAKEEGPSNQPVYYSNCQSSVSKCLKALINEKRILKIQYEKKNVYIPYKVEYARNSIKERITNLVVFNQETVFLFASGREKMRIKATGEECVYATCSLLVDVSFDYIVTAKELFREYIGTKNCYEVMEFQGKVLIMIRGLKDEVNMLKRNIRGIVKETYNKNKKAKKR